MSTRMTQEKEPAPLAAEVAQAGQIAVATPTPIILLARLGCTGRRRQPRGQQPDNQSPRQHRAFIIGAFTIGVFVTMLLGSSFRASALEPTYLAIPNRSIQHVLYPMAQEQGYMEQEGIDLKIVLIAPAVSIQALGTKSVHFTLAGTSALIARSRSNVPFKVVFAANKQVLQWVLTRPEIVSIRQLKDKKIATPGIASSSTFMLKTVLANHGLNPDRDVVFLDPGAGNHLPSLIAGTVDAAILGAEQRYAALAAGMREQIFLGREVRNSWGTLATSERIIQENHRQVHGVLKATVKALRLMRQSKAMATRAMQKFARVDASYAERAYDDLILTFNVDGTVDDETQRSDLAVIHEITRAPAPLPISQAYDFSIVRTANRELNEAGWRP